jgi:exonuclease SbcC
MRPVLLDLVGFGSFREPTTVDFRDVDYFALVGPTGAGKSTVIDALTFALYGSVPRWDDRRTVASALAPTVSRGTVRLIFDVNGRRYVAARELRRTAAGTVNVRNARLERLRDPAGIDGETDVLAADSAVTPAVEELLGLPFDHFITCVVLPQGKFAEFLHEKPAKRQEILIKLLGLEVYQRIGQAANSEANAQRVRAEQLSEQLGGFTDVTAEAEQAARRRVTALRKLAAEVEALLPELAKATTALVEAEAAANRLRAESAALHGLTVPAGLSELDARHRAAAAALERAQDALSAAEEADTAAREALAAAPERTPLEHVRRAWGQLAELEGALPTAQAERRKQATSLAKQQKQYEQAEAALAEARAALDGAQRADLAGTLRPHLELGAECPVCAQPVHELPPAAVNVDLDRAHAAVRNAEAELQRRRKSWQEAIAAEQRATTTATQLDEQVAAFRGALADADDEATVAMRLSEVDAVEAASRAADRRLRETRAELNKVQKATAALGREEYTAWAALDHARDPLVPLGAPAVERGSLITAWTTLTAWATEAAARREKDQPAADRALATARQSRLDAELTLTAALAGADIVPRPGRPLADAAEPAVAVARERADGVLREVKRRRAEAAALEQQRAEAIESQRVAKSLGQLLRADGFQRWLLGTALDVLVADASRTLADLSSGQFELGHDGTDFLVVDHFDADSRRPVKTLSGGETFQASLALALALSSQLAGMAAAGAARLDSIFLDEGFGTLDEATLDVVASTLENLAADGDRMVGVVTHVPALAERVPIRFAVRRDQRGSSVTREAT